MSLKIKNLNVEVNKKQILQNISLNIKKGEVAIILGQNGAGKSTLFNSILNFENLDKSGEIFFEKENITNLKTEEISQKGLFLSFQNPIEIDGLSNLSFLKEVYKSFKNTQSLSENFYDNLDKIIKSLGFDLSYKFKSVNHGFSGGEKKRSEIVQMLLLNPKLILLDEIDSGLDVEWQNKIFKIINKYNAINKPTLLVITHHLENVLKLNPNKIIVLKNGNLSKIIETKSKVEIKKIVNEIKKNGFENF